MSSSANNRRQMPVRRGYRHASAAGNQSHFCDRKLTLIRNTCIFAVGAATLSIIPVKPDRRRMSPHSSRSQARDCDLLGSRRSRTCTTLKSRRNPMADEDIHRIKLRAQSLEELRSFLDGSDFDLGCRPVVRREGNDFVVEVYAPLPQLNRLRSARSARTASAVDVTVVENASEVGRSRQAEVGSGNRFAARQALRGLGIKE
jgi:hypothetical protein